jgi:BirA family biotin operon repressor/biotin-[acetyl-CoA-carboxylase] ligase
MREGRVLTLDKVLSTQDAAIDHRLQAGDVCRCFNQTAGRGRRGNTWNSSGGVAVTVVLKEITPHLPIAIAGTLAAGLNALIPSVRIGLKWPNDLFVENKKLAGILIEHREGLFLVGVGVNVLESPTPDATALSQFGSEPTLEEVSDVIASCVFNSTQLDVNKAVKAWLKRDILVGTTQQVQIGKKIVEGVVLHIDPCHALILDTASGIVECQAAISTIVTHCE